MTLDPTPDSSGEPTLAVDEAATAPAAPDQPETDPALASEQSVAPPLSPAEAARDNARRGTWWLDEHHSGWVLIGADGGPVMRNDGSRVAFSFHNAARLAAELSAAHLNEGARSSAPQELAADRDPDARGPAARRALAPLGTVIDPKWDPQAQRSRHMSKIKLVKLLAYHYALTTEPEEAVRHAFADIFGTRVHLEEPRINAWIPEKYDVRAVLATAGMLLRQVVGPERSEHEAKASAEGEAVPSKDSQIAQPDALLGKDGSRHSSVTTSDQSLPLPPPRKPTLESPADKGMPKIPPGADIDANITEALRHKGNDFWFRRQVTNRGPWDYKRQKGEFADFGNFNYGATGAAIGYTLPILLRMAGWKQVDDKNSRPDWGIPPRNMIEAYLGVGGTPPYGDDPIDQHWIKRGYEYYQKRKQ